MACLYETTVEKVAPGEKMLVEGVGWCIKLQPQEGVEYNAMVESTYSARYQSYTPEGGGKLVIVPAGTKVISGYGWGER